MWNSKVIKWYDILFSYKIDSKLTVNMICIEIFVINSINFLWIQDRIKIRLSEVVAVGRLKKCQSKAFDWQKLELFSAYFRIPANRIFKIQWNKHTESIAKAIQVPNRPQQIENCNHYFGALFNKEQLELIRPLIVFLFHYLMFQTLYVTLHMEACYQLSFQLSFRYVKA